MVFDFFKNLGKQRVDYATSRLKGKQMGVVAKAKGKAAGKFNKAVDAPGKAMKRAAKGGMKKPKGPKMPKGGKAPKMPKGAKAKAPKGGNAKGGGENMGWFSKKKGGQPQFDEEEYEQPEHTVAIDLATIAAQTFQPCVGWVVVLNGELRGRDFRLVDGKNTIGTAADAEVVLTDPYLSSHHAVIRHENGEFTMVDLDSTNGTYVNERRVSREDLIDNDKIRFGRTELKFKSLE